jgi:two-component system sensor histidine kinase LytS
MSLVRTDASEARRLLQELSVILRSGFKDSATRIPIEDELRVIEAFLRIEKARFPEKLIIKYDIDPDVKLDVPPLILQPIVENAVRHGIRNKQGPGTVKISIHKENEKVHFMVSDDGVGIAKDRIDNLKDASGIGISNVRDRLKSLYEANLYIESEPNKGTRVYFSVPISGGR